MVITYYGLSCFKVQSGDITLVFDLPGKNALPAGRQAPRFHYNIAFQSHGHKGHCGAEDLPAACLPARQGKAGVSEKKEFFLANGPGEYEVKGIRIQGFKTYHDSFSGKKRGINTAYTAQIEDVKLCFMGDYAEKELRPELKEGIDKIDILFVPIGEESVLGPEEARNLINQLEPAIAIPMHYTDDAKGKNCLKTFLSEMGQKDIEPVEKLSIKKKDIPEDKGTEVVVLEKQ